MRPSRRRGRAANTEIGAALTTLAPKYRDGFQRTPLALCHRQRGDDRLCGPLFVFAVGDPGTGSRCPRGPRWPLGHRAPHLFWAAARQGPKHDAARCRPVPAHSAPRWPSPCRANGPVTLWRVTGRQPNGSPEPLSNVDRAAGRQPAGKLSLHGRKTSVLVLRKRCLIAVPPAPPTVACKATRTVAGRGLVACCKGIDLETLTVPVASLRALVLDAIPPQPRAAGRHSDH